MKERQVGDIAIIAPRGYLTAGDETQELEQRINGDTETDDVQKAILDEAAAGNTRLVLNMSEVQALNSMAIGVLMRGYANYNGRGGEIKLCGLGRRLHDLFTMTKLIMVFDHHESE